MQVALAPSPRPSSSRPTKLVLLYQLLLQVKQKLVDRLRGTNQGFIQVLQRRYPSQTYDRLAGLS
jgi:hypothetical protein